MTADWHGRKVSPGFPVERLVAVGSLTRDPGVVATWARAPKTDVAPWIAAGIAAFIAAAWFGWPYVGAYL